MNENHKRVLAAYLRHVEKRVDGMKAELEDETAGAGAVLYTLKLNVKQDARTRLLRGASDMLDEIRLIKATCELEPRTESSRSNVRALLMDMWETVNDLRPKTLEGYGPLTTGDREVLDSHVSRLLAILDGMLSSL